MHYDDDQIPDAVGTLEYIGTFREIREAGLGAGFSIREIDEMPEHESEFVPAPDPRSAALEDELAAIAELAPAGCWA